MEQDIFRHHGFGDDDGNNSAGVGKSKSPATVDQIDVTSYLHSDSAADGSFTEQLYLQVKGFELNGSPVSMPDSARNSECIF